MFNLQNTKAMKAKKHIEISDSEKLALVNCIEQAYSSKTNAKQQKRMQKQLDEFWDACDGFKANYKIELSAREFELLAQAYVWWHGMMKPGRPNSSTIDQIDKLLQQFWDNYNERPF